MSPEQLWHRYARIWSSDEPTRSAEIEKCLDNEVRYTDPNASLVGRSALSNYMGGFQASMPGCSFRINSVVHHHECSISFWSLVGPESAELQRGTSFARHAENGKLADISGFFNTP